MSLAARPEQTHQPLPVVTIHYGGEQATIERVTEYKSAIALASTQFSSLAGVSHERLGFEGRTEGRDGTGNIDEALWPSVVHNVTEVTLVVRPDKKDFSIDLSQFGDASHAMNLMKMLMSGSQTSISVETAGQEYRLDVNLMSTRLIDVKKMMQEKLGVPVARQHLIIPDVDPDEYPWPVDDENLAAAGVMRGSKLRLEIVDADDST